MRDLAALELFYILIDRRLLVFSLDLRYKHSLVDFLKPLLRGAARRKGVVFAAVLGACCLLIALNGPQGVQALLEKQREIRQLQEHNAMVSRENERRRERIHRLEDSRSEQEMEIRKQLKLLRPGETTFILPDSPAK